MELHAHVPLLIASCAPCDDPDGLATGNGSAGVTVAESASAAATIAADFMEIFSFTTCAAMTWRTPPSPPCASALRHRSRSMKYGRLSVESLGPSGWFTICRLRSGMHVFKIAPL